MPKDTRVYGNYAVMLPSTAAPKHRGKGYGIQPRNHAESKKELRPPGVSECAKRLRLFKFLLTGRAKDWLDTLPNGTINTWNVSSTIGFLKLHALLSTIRCKTLM
ncbi:hypothetical protein A2U01_0048557 [Trifolium medium]|uniref:Retrotransposon gag domain-containing protein n=1 Tax=Trifolium medium TaxID=97028 RepID=A0A392QTM5_9FABA|nr:hypothetical protein [Trifolium medium]